MLKKEREAAKSLRERFTTSSEVEKQYEAYSSDDLKNSNSYDIQPEVNLQKKLGLISDEPPLEEKPKNEKTTQEQQP